MSSLMINLVSDGGHLISSLIPVGLIREWALTIDIYMSNWLPAEICFHSSWLKKKGAFNPPVWGLPSGRPDTWDIGNNPRISKNVKRFIKDSIGQGY